jgi:transaldolase
VAAYRQQEIKTKVLAASIRNPMHVTQAALAGADIATMPFGVLKMLFLHPLTEAGQKKFLEDYRQARAASGSKADGGARAQPDERSDYRRTQEAKPVPTARQGVPTKR